MAKKIPHYRCNNSDPENPCNRALSGDLIPVTEAISSFGEEFKCPGETKDGNPCENELAYVCDKPVGGEKWWAVFSDLLTNKWVLIVGGAVLALLLLAFIFLSGTPKLNVSTETLAIPYAKSGEASTDLRIRNDGNGKLVIDKIDVQPSEFSVPPGKVDIAPKKGVDLRVSFKAASAGVAQGELVLHSNDKKMATVTIKLIANRNPWWVYRKLDTTSKILRKEP